MMKSNLILRSFLAFSFSRRLSTSMKAVRVQNTGGPEVLKLAEVVKPQAASGITTTR